jgi:hypothetical protein
MPPVIFLEQPPPGVSRMAEAFIDRDANAIVLITSSAVFREARSAFPQCSNARAQVKLASIVAHELWHLQHGADERGAYIAQLTTLVALRHGPGSALYDGVERSMFAALRAREPSQAKR